MKPLQKLTTAGAERVPPAPWVKMKGVRHLGAFLVDLGVYWWQIMGLLTKGEVMERVVGEEDGVNAILGSSGCADLVVVAGFDSDLVVFSVFCTLFLAFVRFLSILPVFLGRAIFVVRVSSWYDFDVCARVEDRVVRSARGTLTAGAILSLPMSASRNQNSP